MFDIGRKIIVDVYSNTVHACGVHIITVDHKVIEISVNNNFSSFKFFFLVRRIMILFLQVIYSIILFVSHYFCLCRRERNFS